MLQFYSRHGIVDTQIQTKQRKVTSRLVAPTKTLSSSQPRTALTIGSTPR